MTELRIEGATSSGIVRVPFIVGDIYEDGDGDHFLLTRVPDDGGFVWVNLTNNLASSVVNEPDARNTAKDLIHIPNAKVVIPAKVTD